MRKENSLMKQYKVHVLPVMAIFTVPMLNIIYTFLNSFNGIAHNLGTKVDNIIPFIRFFIVPYNLWYPFIIISLLFLCFKDRKTFFKTIISIDLGLISCYIIYLIFQTTVPRPDIISEDTFSKLVHLTYSLDKPYNCFPSIHVLTCYLVMKSFYKSAIDGLLTKISVFFIGNIIIISTLFVKQHVILDIIGGIALGEITFYIAGCFSEKKIILWVKKQYTSRIFKKKFEV
jgi:membrane-associated phospholipid phosphatase